MLKKDKIGARKVDGNEVYESCLYSAWFDLKGNKVSTRTVEKVSEYQGRFKCRCIMGSQKSDGVPLAELY